MRTSARVFPRGRALWSAIVAGAVLVGDVNLAGAAATTPVCLARKLREWGRLRHCQATETGKVLQAKPADPARCQTKFDAKLAILNTQARSLSIPCRYGVNGDGTVTDYDTGLQWEQKSADGTVHDQENVHEWSQNLGLRDGTAFTTFLGTLNNGTSSDGTTSTGCFAGHCDWRLPSIVELRTIIDLTVPGCGNGSACIDPVFGPTIAFFYWSATSDADFPVFAWGVSFGDGRGSVFSVIEDAPLFVRGVRSAL